MSDAIENKQTSDPIANSKLLDQTSLVIMFSGLILAVIWLLIATTTALTMTVGWIFSLVLTAIAWLSAVNLNSKSKLPPLTWVFVVLALLAGVLAYTLDIAGISTVIVGLIAGILGGGSLLVTGLIIRTSK